VTFTQEPRGGVFETTATDHGVDPSNCVANSIGCGSAEPGPTKTQSEGSEARLHGFRTCGEHFQDVACGHFTVRRLERIYGKEKIKTEYDLIAGEL
jgi:hypothetical protein